MVSSTIIDGSKYLFIKNNAENAGVSSVVYALHLNQIGSTDQWKYELKAKIEEALKVRNIIIISILEIGGKSVSIWVFWLGWSSEKLNNTQMPPVDVSRENNDS